MNTPNSGGVSPILEMEVCNLPCARSLILSHVPKLSGSQDLGAIEVFGFTFPFPYPSLWSNIGVLQSSLRI